MPQPGNINDPIQRGTGYLPYTYTVPHGEGGAKQLLELDKLRFSLDDFQKLSSGKYNAGYLTLTSKGKLDIANSHKTLTFLNNTKLDSTDAFAIRKAFGSDADKISISSTKGATGHALGAAGALECIFCMKTIETGVIPPTINYETPDPDCDLDVTPNQARQRDVRIAANNNLGFGGHNAVVIFRKYEE